MIGKLKLRCGAQFTGKMEGMLNDLSIALDHAKSFEEYCKSPEVKSNLGKTEFAVQVRCCFFKRLLQHVFSYCKCPNDMV